VQRQRLSLRFQSGWRRWETGKPLKSVDLFNQKLGSNRIGAYRDWTYPVGADNHIWTEFVKTTNGGNLLLKHWAVLFACVFATLLPSVGHTQVVWEDYQGDQWMFGTSNQDKAGPSYSNNTGSAATNRANLRLIAADVTNATRTGTSATIDYAANSGTLCNTSNATAGAGYDAAGTGAACTNDAMGRVAYALVKFPATGTFTFSAAHDDEVDLDLSSDYSNTSYRTAIYDLPVGDIAAYTSGDTVYENLAGVFSSPTANACILLRVYWSNNGGITFFRLRWTRPDGVTQIVPAAQLLDPGLASSSAGCTGSVTSSNTSIVLNKTIATSGRAAAADQFTVTVTDNVTSGYVTSATTSGSGTGQQASTGSSLITNGTVYKLTDTMAAGSSSTLSLAYTPTIACTRASIAFSPTFISTGVWTVSTTATNQQIICNITNSRKSATLQLRKTWVGAVINNAITLPASTGFFSNTTAFNSVANTASETDNSPNYTVYVGEVGTLTAESFTTGTPSAYGSVLSCTAGTLSGTSGQASNTLTVPVAAAGTTIVCTYTNTYRPPMMIVKSSTLFSDPIHGTSFPKMIPGAFVDYTLSITSPSSYAVDNNSLFVSDNLPNTLWLQVTDYGVAGSGPVQFTNGVPVTNLTYGFSTLSSTTDDIQFSNDNGLTWGYLPTATVGTIDPNVTGIRINPKGIMAAGASFTLRFRTMVK
jgi:hypothetical protein